MQREHRDRAALEPVPLPSGVWPEASGAWIDAEVAAGARMLYIEDVEFFTHPDEEEPPVRKLPGYRVADVVPAGRGVLRSLYRQEYSAEYDHELPDGGIVPQDDRYARELLQFLWSPDGEHPEPGNVILRDRLAAIKSYRWARRSTVEIETPLPLESEDDAVRGVYIHLPGLARTRYDRSLSAAFADAGWAVGVAPVFGLGEEDQEFAVDEETRASEVVERFSRIVTDRLAERAMAVEALVAEMRGRDERLTGLPVVVGGCSAGAIGASTIVAYRPELYDAVILVCGGANAASISRRSSFSRRLKLEGVDGAPVPDGFLENVDRAHLEASPLDPFHTASALVDHPVLMLHGRSDTWVPADTGDVLWERLGRPERWVYWGGHRTVFWRLPSLAKKLERWAWEAVSSGD